MKRQLLEFRLAGVDKDDATRKKLKELNDQADRRAVDVRPQHRRRSDHVEAKPSELDGLPQDYIDRHKPHTNGKIIITTD